MSLLNHCNFKLDQKQLADQPPRQVEFDKSWIRFPNEDPSQPFDPFDVNYEVGNVRSLPIGWLEYCEQKLLPGQWAMGTYLRNNVPLRYIGAKYLDGQVVAGLEVSSTTTVLMSPSKIRVYDVDFNVPRKVYHPFIFNENTRRQRCWRVMQAYIHQTYNVMLVPYLYGQAVEHFNKQFARLIPARLPDGKLVRRDWWKQFMFIGVSVEEQALTPDWFDDIVKYYDRLLLKMQSADEKPPLETLADVNRFCERVVDTCRELAGFRHLDAVNVNVD